jgi:putative inorganic carbon (hco3(-)) transporter
MAQTLTARPAFPIRSFLLLACFGSLIPLVLKFDAPLVLMALLLIAGLAFVLPRPELTMSAVFFLLYINFPAIAHQVHGLPKVAAGAMVLLLAFPLLRVLIVERQRIRIDLALLLMVAFMGVLLLSSFFAQDKGIAFARILAFGLEGIIIYWLVINLIRSRRALHRMVWTLLAAGSLLGGLSLYQSATGSYDQQFGGLAERQLKFEYKRAGAVGDSPKVHRSDRADGPLVGNNRYAQIMIVLLPLAFFHFRRAQSLRTRVVAAGAGFFILSGVILTYSRGAFVALVGLVLLACLFKWLRPAHVAVGALCMVALMPFFAPNLLVRLESIGAATALAEEDPAAHADGAIRGRATAMMAAYQVFLDHPILGVGPGQYVPFYSIEYQQLPEFKFRDIQSQRRAHSLYLEMAAETGLVGLIAFLAIPFSLIVALVRLRRRYHGRDREYEDLAIAFTLSISAYLATGIFLHLAFQRYYWLLLAMAGAAVLVMRAASRQPSDVGPVATGMASGFTPRAGSVTS